MPHGWESTILDTIEKAEAVFTELQGKRWLFRGHSKRYNALVPSIDRYSLKGLSRPEKLLLERKSIDLFRSTAHFFASTGEKGAMTDDFVALMVLRHYGVPARLLDWSISPSVAAYFATCEDDEEDGEIWCFDESAYAKKGKLQWEKWPETTTDGSGNHDKFAAGLTAFVSEPPDWFIAVFYPLGFPRQNAQSGAYTITAHFDIDHAAAIKKLLSDDSQCHLYIVSAGIKSRLRTILRESHGVWNGSLFPDSAGAAKTVCNVLFPEKISE